ncbi:Putative uncharacterized protein FLJ37770 [Eumeta japonica]|uniref:Histone-lysine N-methyltransferase SETMAR n=1 Tax=Eumeta variegata TaxID=151549 RepID=A0A4C1TX48_EUMVA|nr:Putative uncharacterized protein FLJ37770 [Eumeta japonica]
MNLAIVYNWFNGFKRGRTNLTDDLREGGPSTAITEDTIGAVQLMIETDKRVTYQQIQTTLGIGMSQVHKILHEDLAVKKLCTRFVRHVVILSSSGDRVCSHIRFRESGGGSVIKSMSFGTEGIAFDWVNRPMSFLSQIKPLVSCLGEHVKPFVPDIVMA